MAEENKVTHETYVITEEAMAEVNTYLPIRLKTELIERLAERCISKAEITASIDGQDMLMPPMYRENANIKSRYLMGIFVRLYLCGTFKPELENDIWLIPEDEYDKWAGGHVFNQIERLKQNPKLKNICFDLIADYKDFEKRFNSEVYALVNAMNDPVARQLAAMQASVTPGSIEGMMEQLKEIQSMRETGENNE